jgi:PAS domain S-box-containing protein
MSEELKLTTEAKKDLFENIIENNWDAIVFANMKGVVEFVNSAANNLYGYEENELIGQNVDVFNSHLTHNTEEIVSELMEKGHWHGELIQRRKDDNTSSLGMSLVDGLARQLDGIYNFSNDDRMTFKMTFKKPKQD